MNDQEQNSNWIARHPRIVILLANLLCLVFLEGSLRLLAYNGLVQIREYPSAAVEHRFLGDINPHFGVWHFPNRTVSHASPCFNVNYTSNSYGARDKERLRDSVSDNRVVVLGDSFVEGYGVSLDQRMTDIAEHKSGLEFLNFGTSGSFGSIQQWLLYKELAKNFDHSHVAIFLLPDNDFKDNNPDNFSKKRYRPYLRKDAQEKFELYYTVPFDAREQFSQMSWFRSFRRDLYNKIYTLNLIRQMGEAFERSSLKNSISDEVKQSSGSNYNDFSDIDMDRLLHSYEEIIELAQDKEVVIFVTPREYDLEIFEGGNRESALIKRLQAFASNYKNVKIVDLMPVFLDYAKSHGLDSHEFFHACDGHWSELGNQIAGETLADVFS